jgi:hypothetical protein
MSELVHPYFNSGFTAGERFSAIRNSQDRRGAHQETYGHDALRKRYLFTAVGELALPQRL